MEDKSKRNKIGNYGKLLTDIVADRIYQHLGDNYLLLQEQKGCCRKNTGNKNHLLICEAVMKNCRRKKVGLSMVWIDY